MRFGIPARFLLLCAALFVTGPFCLGQAAPWLAHSGNFVMTLFHLKGDAVQKLLPAGIKARVNEAGMVVAGLEMYATDRIHGIPNYTAAFIFVEITGHDSANGTPGHWAIWGRVSDQVAAASFQQHFGLPFIHEPHLTRGPVEGDRAGTVGAPGREVLRVRIAAVADQPFIGEGIVNMVARTAEGRIVRSEVPWFSTGSSGRTVAFAITPRGDPALELVKDAVPFWAIISVNQTFSYSRPRE